MPEKDRWDKQYRINDSSSTPWEIGHPDKHLVDIVKSGQIKGTEVLDVCSGLGTQSIFLAKHGYNVSGVEVSPTAVKKAKDAAEKAEVKIDFKQGYVQNLEFPDNSFDFIFDRGCLHHQYDKELEDYLLEINRVLKPGGRMVVIAFTNRFDFEEIEKIFSPFFIILEHTTFKEKSATGYLHELNFLFIEKKDI